MKYNFVLKSKGFCLSCVLTALLAIAGAFPVISGKSQPFSSVDPIRRGSTGTWQLITLQGSGAFLNNGDYVSDASGLNTAHRYFIEVPPGLARLNVEVFDADVGLGGSSEANLGRDRARGGAFNSSVRYTLLNPSGIAVNTAFSTGDEGTPAGSDNAWLSLLNSNGASVQDNFSLNAYNNNDGIVSWSGNWIETNDDNNPLGGEIRVTGGELRIGDNGGSASTIEREADLSGFPDAVLSFNFRTTGVDAGDQMRLQISGNGGAAWTTLETFTGAFAASSRSYDIGPYIAANTRVRFIQISGYGNNDFFFVDNLRINRSTIPAGHWELRADMSSAVTSGDDINAFGLRANDGNSTSGGTELNIYADSIYAIGANPPFSGTSSRSYALYPYITSGCSCGKNDFDYDSNAANVGSLTVESRTGAYTMTFGSNLLSDDSDWRRDTFNGWTSDTRSRDYGIWTLDAIINSYLIAGTPNGNYTNLYFSNFQAAANPPAANPASNAFRIYLPTDADAAPAKPYLEQDVVHFSIQNPPAVGQTTRERVVVRLVNPTAHPIAFSASKIVTANVPGAGTVFGGNAQVGQGSVLSQPAVGGMGNITWNPGTVAAGATAVLVYDVLVTPSVAGQRVPLTGTPASGNGTRATFVDETGNQTQARATYTLGPICELAITVGNFVPISNCGTIINPNSLPNAAVGTLYNQSFSAGVELSGGTLPNGLTFANSTLSGVPTESGVFTFLVGTTLNSGAVTTGCVASRNYTLTVNAPTAAGVEIAGRVLTTDGRAISGATIKLIGANGEPRSARTNSFGYYRFLGVEAGETYTFQVYHKRYNFEPQVVAVNDGISDLIFVAQERRLEQF